ncbi:MAG: Snf7 family protein [Candidatus Bathyarchaeia archaeon]
MGIKSWDKGARLIHREPLKKRIDYAAYRLRVQKSRLEGASMRMAQHDRELFEKCVSAQTRKDSQRAAMYANECAEVRKMAKVVLRGELALEQVLLRLETVEEFGDFAASMKPVIGVVHSLRSQLAGVIPEVSYELGEISEDLGKIVMDIGESTGRTWEIEPSGEAQKILDDAGALAEQRMKEKFPELPAAVPSVEKGIASQVTK